METKTKIDVSIIIVNYHSFDLVQQCLRSIQSKTKEVVYEVIIVDNSENSQEFNRLLFLSSSNIHIIDGQKNNGFGSANNIGAKEANGKYLFFLNNDTLLANNAVFSLFSFLEQNPNAGICGGSLYSPFNRPITSFFRNEYNLANIKKSNSLCVRLKRHLGKRDDFNYGKSPIQIHGYVSGANLMISKNLFQQIGGFDPLIFMYGEDSLLCFLCQKKFKKQVWQNPNAKIIHLEGQSSKKSSGSKAALFVEGTYLYFLIAYGREEALRFVTYSRNYYHKQMAFAFASRKKRCLYRDFYSAFSKKANNSSK